MFSKTPKTLFGIATLIILITLLVVGYRFFGAPSNFPVNKIFLIKEGESIKSVSARLEDEGYVKSALLFRIFLSGYEHDRKLQLGYYAFPESLSVQSLVYFIISKGPTAPFGKITLPEGSTDQEIARIVHMALPEIEEKDILEEIKTQKVSGFLFPETYYLVPSMKKEEIINRMQGMFIKKTATLFDNKVTALDEETKNKLQDTVVLASILEGEAKTKEDMELVSGILQKRLRLGMALQVDVAPETYKVRGLPHAPINNPGLVALNAALHPKESEYLYYITGKDGNMYYAKTFAEHKKNIQKYLK